MVVDFFLGGGGMSFGFYLYSGFQFVVVVDV